MPLVLTVTQLTEMADGAVPEAFKGKIKTVLYPPRTGETGGRKWKMQKVFLTDGAKEIEMILDNRDEDVPRAAEGKQIYVEAGRGEKGLKGLKRAVYKDKPQIKVFDSATITIEGMGTGTVPPSDLAPKTEKPPAQSQERQAPQNPPPGTTATRTEAPPPAEEVSHAAARAQSIKGFNLALGKSWSALSRCYDAAIAGTKDLTARHPDALGAGKPLAFTTSDIKEIAMGLLIQTCFNQKPSSVEDFPVKPFQKYTEDGNLVANGTNGNGHAPAEKPAFN